MTWKGSDIGMLGLVVALPKSHVSVPRQTYVRDTFHGLFAAVPVVRSSSIRVSSSYVRLLVSTDDGMLMTQRGVFFGALPVEPRFVENAAGDVGSGRFSTGDGMYSSA